MPRILLLHLRNHLLRHVEEAGDVGIHHQVVVFFGVVGERLRHIDSSIVNQQINTAEMFDGCVYHLDGGFFLADVSIHEDELRRRPKVLRAADRAGGAHHAPAAFEQCLCHAQADSARSAGDDGDRLLGCIHRMSFCLRVSIDIAFYKNELLRMSVHVLRTIELGALEIFKAVWQEQARPPNARLPPTGSKHTRNLLALCLRWCESSPDQTLYHSRFSAIGAD